MMRLVVTALVVIGVASLSVACGGGGTTPTPTNITTSSATIVGTRTTQASSRHTGVSEVDPVIDAVESRNVGAVLALIDYTYVPCTSTPPPVAVEYIRCATGQPEGSQVAAFLLASCEGTFMVNSTAIDLRKRIGAVDGRVFAVYRAGARAVLRTGGFPTVDYAVVLTYSFQGRAAGLALLVGGHGIVGIDEDCVLAPAQMAHDEHFGEAILKPQPPVTQ